MEWNLDPADCVHATHFINFDHPAVQECFRNLNLDDLPNDQKAVRIFEFVRDAITYEFKAKLEAGLYIASRVLEIGRGFCCQKAVLQTALGRAAGIPSAVVLVALRDRTLPDYIVEAMGTDTLRYHGLGAFYLNGRWLRADATLSPDLVERKGYRLVEFNGEEDALFASTTLAGEPHGEYTEWIGAFADLPIDQMFEDFHKFWESRGGERLKNMSL